MSAWRAAASLAKVAAGLDKAPLAVRTERLSICTECPWRIGLVCSPCGCVVTWKVRLSSETCPRGRW